MHLHFRVVIIRDNLEIMFSINVLIVAKISVQRKV